jgi:ribosomal protein S27AE
MDGLKPCPMCGPGMSIVEYYRDDYGKWRIACGACGLHSGIRVDNSLSKLIEYWNTRPMEGGEPAMSEPTCTCREENDETDAACTCGLIDDHCQVHCDL